METGNFPRAEGIGAPVVSSDLDGTMINNDGSYADVPYCDILEAFIAIGGGFALNSDTSLQGLRLHALRMGIGGLVSQFICECGAYMTGELGNVEFGAGDFRMLEANHAAIRSHAIRIFRDAGYDVVLTHPATTINAMLDQPWPAAGGVLLLDATRRVSLTASMLVVEERRLVTHEAANTMAARLIGDAIEAAQEIRGTVDSGDWWIDVPASGCRKDQPLSHIRRTTRRPVYHIGDGSNDIAACDAEGVVVIAVGPGCKLARSGRAHYVTQASGPAGWVEAMRLITEAHRS